MIKDLNYITNIDQSESTRRIPFNKPFIVGDELKYITEAVSSGKLSGNGIFTKKVHDFFKKRYGFKHCLMTSSCTDALEMSAILLNIQPGDEVICPSYTFVSTANAFALHGAKIVFVDSELNTPNLCTIHLEKLISSRTKAIVVVHYGGVACDMDAIMELAQRFNIPVVEDAAHAIDATYKGRPLGSIGDLATFSFHETKNVICGEGGLLVVNNPAFIERSEIIWEKGTNRTAFARGEVQKYNWIDVGSSFLSSEIHAAFLMAQLEHIENIQKKRISIWTQYSNGLADCAVGNFRLPYIPNYASINGHLFFLLTKSVQERDRLLDHLKSKNILAVFHYLSLTESPFAHNRYKGPPLRQAKYYSDTLIRLPLFYDLTDEEIVLIIETIKSFYL